MKKALTYILLNFKKIGLIISVAIMLVVGLSALFASYVTEQNSTYITGHFSSLNKGVVRGDVSYDLYLTESDNCYRISAEWAHCFSAEQFQGEVKPGDPVELYLGKGALPFSVPQVAWLSSNGINYLDMDCVNDDISENRYKLPIFSLVISLFAIGLFLADKNKKKRKLP